LSKGGRGLLLLLDKGKNQVRLEVSRALEAVYPDAFAGYIEVRQMAPFFAANRVADGILASTEMIVTRAQHATAQQGWDDEPWSKASTAGGGATSPAKLGEGASPLAVAPGQKDIVVKGDSPQDTLAAYMLALGSHNINPRLTIYSKETQSMLGQSVRTTAQMDNALNAFRQCQALPYRESEDRQMAVIRYSLDQRFCSPWFFKREDGVWRLDLSTQRAHIRFGRDNFWHFDAASFSSNPYRFAFVDWEFDEGGYPLRPR
jgi:uncharacterized protein